MEFHPLFKSFMVFRDVLLACWTAAFTRCSLPGLIHWLLRAWILQVRTEPESHFGGSSPLKSNEFPALPPLKRWPLSLRNLETCPMPEPHRAHAGRPGAHLQQHVEDRVR